MHFYIWDTRVRWNTLFSQVKKQIYDIKSAITSVKRRYHCTWFEVKWVQIDWQRGLLTQSLGHHFPEAGVGWGLGVAGRRLRILRVHFRWIDLKDERVVHWDSSRPEKEILSLWFRVDGSYSSHWLYWSTNLYQPSAETGPPYGDFVLLASKNLTFCSFNSMMLNTESLITHSRWPTIVTKSRVVLQ